jgi:hypothetical protein
MLTRLRRRPYRSTRRPRRLLARLEALEDRTVLSGGLTLFDAPLLTIPASQAARRGDFLAGGNAHALYAVTLAQGDRLSVAAAAADLGSGLNSYLRVFDAGGHQLFANDDRDGRDAGLTFQAATTGSYYLGVSAAGNDAYDPVTGAGDAAAATHGLFELRLLRLAQGAALQPDLVGGSFTVDRPAAVAGEQVTINYRIENRGGADVTSPFTVQFVLAPSPAFSGVTVVGSTVIAASALHPLAADGFVSGTVTLPALPAFAAGRAFLGMRIDSGDAVAESDEQNNVGQHAGADWAELDVLQPTTTATLAPFGRASGSLATGDSATYQVTLPADGLLTVRARGDGIDTRVSLLDHTRRRQQALLIQSEGQTAVGPDDLIAQHLTAETYLVKIEHAGGAATGDFTLDTTFAVAAAPPGEKTPSGPDTGNPGAAAMADLNGDGVADLVSVHSHPLSGHTADLRVSLGLGDGTFAPETVYPVGFTSNNGIQVAVGDVNGDGRPDVVVASGNFGQPKFALDVQVFLNRGDGTLTPGTVGALPDAENDSLRLADLNNDGRLDLLITGLGFPTGPSAPGVPKSWAFLGHGDGTFGAAPAGGPLGTPVVSDRSSDSETVLADFDGDGYLDMAGVFGSTIDVYRGNGDGTFSASQSLLFASGTPEEGTITGSPRGLIAADFTGDGRPDLAFALTVTFRPPNPFAPARTTYEVGVLTAAAEAPSPCRPSPSPPPPPRPSPPPTSTATAGST